MNWPMIPVSELCELAADCVNKTAPTVDHETEFKMIRTTNVKDGFIDLKEVRFVTEEVFKKWTRRSRLQYGDVVLTREAPVGEVGRFTSNDEKVFLGQRLFHYRPNPNKLDWNFLAYALQSPQVQGKFKGMGFGATLDHVRVGDAERLPIPCPSLNVQKRIGDTLSAYDDMIENNRRRIQLLEQAARLLYKEWFVRLRFPGHEHTQIINGIPEGWGKTTIGESASFISRGITPKYDDDSPGIVINQKCIRNRMVNLNYARRQSKQVHPPKLVQVGDVLINSTGAGTLGRVAHLLFEIDKCTVDSHVTIVRPKEDVPVYYFGLHLTGLESYIATLGRGATNQTELSKDDISALEIVLPSSSSAQIFESIVAPTFRQIRIISEQIEKLTKARDLLLPKLMNGEVAV